MEDEDRPDHLHLAAGDAGRALRAVPAETLAGSNSHAHVAGSTPEESTK